MQIAVSIGLLAIGVALFLAKKWVSDDSLQRLANAFAVAALIAAALVFVVPAAAPREAAPQTTPTSTPAPECPQGLVCYRSNFEQLDPTLFCTTPQQGYKTEGGQLVVTAGGDTAYEFKPCESLAWNLQFVELTLAIQNASGQPGHAFAGIGASLSQGRYMYLQLDSGDNAFVAHGTGNNPSERDNTLPVDPANTPHKLRIEYTGDEATFFIDGKRIDTTIATDGQGNWFLLNVSAWPGAGITAGLDEVIWGVLP